MSLKGIFAGAACVMTVMAADPSARAAAPAAATAPASPIASANRQSPHASLRLDVGREKAWVGQALPVTLRAYFRGVEGVTLEGRPELTSPGLFTSDLAHEPRQSTQMIGGEPTIVATWTGTVTPSSDAPLSIAAELPVKLRYREEARRVEVPDLSDDDPFDAFAGSPFDTSFFNRFFHESMGQSLGRLHEENVSLRAPAQTLEVRALPTADQPASFTGAIGRFDLKASISSSRAHVSEPVTLEVVVEGTGDLERVDLAGVATSDAWKAYPPSSTIVAPARKGGRPRKVFKQILVPRTGGDLSVPSVSLTSFDPDSGRYVTRETTPLAISVDEAAIPAGQANPTDAAPASLSPLAAPRSQDAAPLAAPRGVSARKVALAIAPVTLLIATAGLLARARRKRAEPALRRAMRSAASRGDVIPFYRAAHALIEARLSERCAVPPEDVSVAFIRERFGADGGPLAEALVADEALRFGRARLDNTDLVPLCASIERSLGGAS